MTSSFALIVQFISKKKKNYFKQWKMKPLFISKCVMSWLCIYTDKDHQPSIWQKIAHAIFTFIVFASNYCCVAAHWTFFVEFFTTNFQQSLFSAMIIILFIPLCYILVFAPTLRQKTRNIFDMLAVIYDASKFNRVFLLFD